MTLIDVIIGVKNEEQHLKRCLDSLKKQTITDINILVIDGRSQDKTRDIVQKMAQDDPRIQLLDNPQEVISTARNIGFKTSKAEYVAYLDGHCYVDPEWLEKLLQTYQKHIKDCKLGGVGSTYASPDNDTPLGKVIATSLQTPFGGLGTAYTQDPKLENVETVAFALYPRLLLKKEAIFYDETMNQCEDTDLNYQLIKKGYVLLKNPQARVYQYRRRTLGVFFQQMVNYGEGRAKFTLKNKKIIHWYHLLPSLTIAYLLLFLLSAVTYLAGFLPQLIFLAIITPLIIYLLIDLYYTIQIRQKTGQLTSFLVFPSIHLGYGWGFWKGILRGK